MAQTITPESLEKARRALQAFRNLQPTLNAYARMLTGRADIVVEASAHDNGSTDNKKIYYRPPIELGEKISHKRAWCDRRNEDGLMRCPACAQREKVLVTIYHEIAHIWFGSFDKVSDVSKQLAIKSSVTERGDKYSVGIAKALDQLKWAGRPIEYMGLASIISPFLPILLNALEDARVNRALFRALPGTKAMFDANTEYIFECGVEQMGEDGNWERELWKDRKLNMQAMIGIFCMASGYTFDNWLDPFVVHALNDDTLRDLIKQLDDRSSVDTSFTLSYPILVRLRELGFFRTEEDPEDDYQEPPPPPEDEPKSDDKKEESDGDDEGDQKDDSDEPGDEPESGDIEEDAGGGDDSEQGDDDSGDGDETGPGDTSEQDAPDEGDEEVDETDGGDQSEAGSSRPEADGEDSDGDPESDGDSSGDSDSESDVAGEAGDEVSEEDSADGAADASSADPDSDGVRDGDQSGGGDLDGSEGEDSGEPDDSEPGNRAVGDREPDGTESASSTPDDNGSELAEADPADAEAIDTGTFTHGTRIEGELEPPKKPDIDWGDAEDVEIVVAQLGDHEPPTSIQVEHQHNSFDDDGDDGTNEMHSHRTPESKEGDETIKVVIVQDMYFEKPSIHVSGVSVIKEGDAKYYKGEKMMDYQRVREGIDLPPGEKFDPEEVIVAPAVMRGRIVFADNFRARHETGLRRGRVHGPSLARKAPFNDPKLFSQRRLPGREDYFVGIGVDMSGSAIGKNIVLAKQVAFAEAEMLDRLGIPFFLFGHTGDIVVWDTDPEYHLQIFEIKAGNEPWNDVTRNRLRKMAAQNVNLDGHTFSLYRKELAKYKATTKIMHYYTDGAMPASNYEEELRILREELVLYKRDGIILTGVGINTDSPKQYGLNTVEVTCQADVIKVVDDLEKQLTKR